MCAEHSPAGSICGACLKRAPRYDSTTAPFRYAFPTDKLVQALKYGHRLAIAPFLAEAMLAGCRPAGDLLLPLPLSPARLRERGFNQAAEIARTLARATGLAMDLDGCHRARDTLPQATLPWPERRRNIRGAFECRLDLSGRVVIVVDDVMTSGATLDEFAGILKQCGAAEVHNWVACRAIRDLASAS
jgi:ComF family protein